jgi:hypothetical protein
VVAPNQHDPALAYLSFVSAKAHSLLNLLTDTLPANETIVVVKRIVDSAI